MNWLLPAVLIFLIMAAWNGHRRGFVKKIVGVVSLILTFFATSAAVPYVAALLKEKTALYSVLQKGIASSDNDVFQMMEMIGLGDKVSGYLADMILQVAAFVITLVLVGILIQGIALSLGIAARLPVLHGINKTAGMVLGLAEGILAVWIFFFVITMCATTKVGGSLLYMVAQSDILSWIYRQNLLFLLLPT